MSEIDYGNAGAFADGREAASASRGPGLGADDVGDALRVLLEDPQPPVRRFMAFAFTSNNCAGTTAASADDALQILATERVDLMVTNIDLPGPSGLDLLLDVKGKYPGIPVFLRTGAPSLASALFGLRHQAYDYLPKPFSTNGSRRTSSTRSWPPWKDP